MRYFKCNHCDFIIGSKEFIEKCDVCGYEGVIEIKISNVIGGGGTSEDRFCSKCGNVLGSEEKINCKSCEEPSAPKEERALRFNSGKIEMDTIPWNAISAFATVCMANSADHGGVYPNGNWRKGAPQSQYFNCALRHYAQHAMGHRIDPTDGMPHLWKAMWNFMVAVEDSIVHPENDDLKLNIPLDFDRFTKMIKELEEKRGFRK